MKPSTKSRLMACLAGVLLIAGMPFATGQETPLETEGGIAAAVELPELEGHLLDMIRRNGELRVGVSTFIPWVMRDVNGELIGFEVDVANQLAKDLGVELKLVPTSWGDIISDLLDGYYDIIVSGFSITPQRALLVDFSDPYHYSEVTLLANTSKAGGLSRAADFNNAERMIGIRNETTAAEIAERELPNATLKGFDDEEILYQALHAGDIHALLASSARPALEALRFPEKLYMPLANSEKEYLARRGEAFAVRKGNQSLLNYLNAWSSFHQLDGFISERDRYWFRSLDWLSKTEPERND